MKHTADHIHAFKREAMAWIRKNELGGQMKWWKAQEYYGDRLEDFADHCYLVFTDENNLYDALHGLPGDHPNYEEYRGYAAEFDAILEKHGLWLENHDNVTWCVMGDAKVPESP